jgi:cobalt-zinc-cadmium efflux system membrane fusion protein
MASADGLANVTAHASGTLTRVIVRLGDAVKAGDVLASVESREAAAMVAEQEVAESRLKLARSTLQREQSLFEQRVTPRQDLETAQAQLAAAETEARRARSAAQSAHVAADGRSLQVVSPMAGRVTAVNAALGAFVQMDDELFRIADPAHIQVEAAVPPVDARAVSPGDPAVVSTASGVTYMARVRSLTPAVNEQTRSVTAVLSFDGLSAGERNGSNGNVGQGGTGKGVAGKGGAGPMPAPGEFVQVRITPQSAIPSGLVVPEDAVQRLDGRDVVFVRTAEGFHVQPVVIGSRSGGRALVVSGLTAGEQIATRNAFFLKAELGKGAEDDE